MTPEDEVVIGNTLAEIATIRSFLESRAEAYHLSTRILNDLNLALEEIVTNIILHGYRDQDTHRIQLTFQCEGDRVSVRIRDDGVPFNPVTHPAPDNTLPLHQRQPGGQGIHFVRQLMDRMTYRREKEYNVLEILKKTDES